MKFIKVRQTNSYESYINTDHIVCVRENTIGGKSYAILELSDRDEGLYLDMSVNQVLNLIGGLVAC